MSVKQRICQLPRVCLIAEGHVTGGLQPLSISTDRFHGAFPRQAVSGEAMFPNVRIHRSVP